MERVREVRDAPGGAGQGQVRPKKREDKGKLHQEDEHEGWSWIRGGGVGGYDRKPGEGRWLRFFAARETVVVKGVGEGSGGDWREQRAVTKTGKGGVDVEGWGNRFRSVSVAHR